MALCVSRAQLSHNSVSFYPSCISVTGKGMPGFLRIMEA